jgi:adenosine deaminase
MTQNTDEVVQKIKEHLIFIISETNGISLTDTLELLSHSYYLKSDPIIKKSINEFRNLISSYKQDEVDISTLLKHHVSTALFQFLREVPVRYNEDHTHLTGSLSAEFIYARLKPLLAGKHKKLIEKKIVDVYGEDSIPIKSVEDVDRLIRLKDGEMFDDYLRILFLAKLVLNSKEAHEEAAFSMASELYNKYNIGRIRLKFTLSRSTGIEQESIPGIEKLTEEDVIEGLYNGFQKFKKKKTDFAFTLSPSFRKELNFYDTKNYKNKEDHFNKQVDSILEIINSRPHLKECVTEVDTVGDEKELYRKVHFDQLKKGLRRLQYHGLKIRSHHGENWKILRYGIQSVDNAMNIWRIDTLEHGLALGMNPNYYYHSIYQSAMKINQRGEALGKKSLIRREVEDMNWPDDKIKNKLLDGKKLKTKEVHTFLKTKFHYSQEIEQYQHDVLNRLISKHVTLISLPSSNQKLTGQIPNFKDHPFSWWEKKGIRLGIGTDNYITLSTNFINEMLILLYSDPDNLKIKRLVMLASGETRRPHVAHMFWTMRKNLPSLEADS